MKHVCAEYVTVGISSDECVKEEGGKAAERYVKEAKGAAATVASIVCCYLFFSHPTILAVMEELHRPELLLTLL